MRRPGGTTADAALVDHATAVLADGVAAATGGRLVGVHVVGSVALGAARPDSDLDLVVVVDGLDPARDAGPLRALHAALHRRDDLPPLDGCHVTPAALAADPRTARPALRFLDGELSLPDGTDPNPVTWLVLGRSGRTTHGAPPTAVHVDDRAVRGFCRENLQGYWSDRLAELAAAGPARAGALDPAVTWCVPGVLRLLHTVRTGEVIAKDAVLAAPPAALGRQHAGIVDEAARLRGLHSRPSPFGSPAARGTALLALLTAAVGAVSAG